MSRYRPVKERLADFLPVEVRLPPEEFRPGMQRCQDCGIPFCHASGCTLANVIPEMYTHALAGRWGHALSILLSTNPFPEFTARICPALCEGSCVQGLHGDPTPCRELEKEIIERGFAQGLVRPNPPREWGPLRAAVIGSGPSGLAAAWRLNQAGIKVTVYERDQKPGGFLRYGIPDFKLEKEVVDRRLELLTAEGISFECGVDVGLEIAGRLLKRRFDLIVLATGARKKRNLAIPGRFLTGIHYAVDFLSAQNRLNAGEADTLPPGYSAKGKKVVVIGGGDTGSDCIGTSWRQGAQAVNQYEILPEPPRTRGANNPWPEWPRIRRDSSSHAEGGERRWNITTLEFLPDSTGNALGSLRCAEVEWQAGANGQFTPVVREGSEFIQPADLCLLAMGFTGVEECPVYTELGVKIAARGTLERDPSLRSGNRVFVAGDASQGPTLVVRAIADGLAVAEAALSEKNEPRVTAMTQRFGLPRRA
ncbi:MAG: glutamate synthase subunit beta [Planctomycetota bacterium]|jgi:glutamate synthase (NADPH/NADH) small chain|nr:glutamate synthase subunit beta [Planctomycetota bacterium]